MAAVTRGIDDRILRSCRNTALQNRFKSTEIIVILLKAQVINEQDKFQRVFAELVKQTRKQMQLILRQLDQAQSLTGKFVSDRLDRCGFAGAGISVQQDI